MKRTKTPQQLRMALGKKCDRLFSELIRSRGECELRGTAECRGVLQCCHGFSRRFRSLRWDERNAFAGCAGCHLYFTKRPDEWTWWLLDRWGSTLYFELKNLALAGAKPDLEAIEADLRARLEVV